MSVLSWQHGEEIRQLNAVAHDSVGCPVSELSADEKAIVRMKKQPNGRSRAEPAIGERFNDAEGEQGKNGGAQRGIVRAIVNKSS